MLNALLDKIKEFQFLMVRLKVYKFPSIFQIWHISIPYGAIKS